MLLRIIKTKDDAMYNIYPPIHMPGDNSRRIILVLAFVYLYFIETEKKTNKSTEYPS